MSKHVEIAVTTHGSPASSLSNPSRSAASIAPFAADQLSSPKRASRCQLNDTQGYPQTIHSNRVFHDFHHPFWSTPIFGNIQNISFCRVFFWWKPKLRTICHLSQGYRQVLFFADYKRLQAPALPAKQRAARRPEAISSSFQNAPYPGDHVGFFSPPHPGICGIKVVYAIQIYKEHDWEVKWNQLTLHFSLSLSLHRRLNKSSHFD